MAHRIRTVIQITASAEHVWEVLTDFDSWPEWNAADPGFSGSLKEGARVELTSATPTGKTQNLKIKLTTVDPSRQLTWESGFPLLFKARHTFRIQAEEGGCVVHNDAFFRGLLVPFIRGQLPTETMFTETNRGLKHRAESVEGGENQVRRDDNRRFR